MFLGLRESRRELHCFAHHSTRDALHPTSTDRKTSGVALQLLRRLLQPLFFVLLLLLLRFPTCVCGGGGGRPDHLGWVWMGSADAMGLARSHFDAPRPKKCDPWWPVTAHALNPVSGGQQRLPRTEMPAGGPHPARKQLAVAHVAVRCPAWDQHHLGVRGDPDLWSAEGRVQEEAGEPAIRESGTQRPWISGGQQRGGTKGGRRRPARGEGASEVCCSEPPEGAGDVLARVYVCRRGGNNKGDGLASQSRRYRVPGQPLLNRHQVGGVSHSPDGLFAQQEREPIRGRPAVRGKRTYGGRLGQRVEKQGTWASRTQKHSEAGYRWPVDRGAWTAKTVKRPRQQPAHPPLMRKRHTMPHSAQPQHTNHWAPRTRKRHQQEHWPQRPTESCNLTQHAKGRTGDCPGPRKETTTRRNVTQRD